MKWATRRGIHIDRAASAWLIERYIDTDAEFVFIDDLDNAPPDATTFDMVGGDLTHRGDDVTFETILRTYEIFDPVLWRIAEIVHEADVEDDRFDAPEAPGFDVIIRALENDHDDDFVRTTTATILDSLESYFRRETLGIRSLD